MTTRREHSRGERPRVNNEIPKLCKCGCGIVTTRVTQNDFVYGIKVGEYRTFVAGHYHIWKRQSNPEWGKQSQRRSELETLRPRLLRGEDVSGHFTTKPALVSFTNFTREFAPLLGLPILFPAVVRAKRETYEEFVARRLRNDEVRQARRRLMWDAYLQRQTIRVARREEREYRNLLKREAWDRKVNARRVLAELVARIRAKNERAREIRRGQKCFEWDDNGNHKFLRIDSDFSSGGSWHNVIPSKSLTPLEELIEKEEALEREEERRFEIYVDRIGAANSGRPFNCAAIH